MDRFIWSLTRGLLSLLSLALMQLSSSGIQAQSVLAAIDSAVASERTAVVAFGAEALHFRILEEDKGRSQDISLEFDPASVVEAEAGRIQLFGQRRNTSRLEVGIWSGEGLTGWQFVRALPPKTLTVFMIEGSYAAIECLDRDGHCSIGIYNQASDSRTEILLPPNLRLDALSQPVWRSDRNSVLMGTLDDDIVEFDLDDRTLRTLAKGEHPKLSHDGSNVAFLRDGALWIHNLHDATERVLVTPSILSSDVSHVFAWSVDDNAIYVNFATGLYRYTCSRVNLATGKRQRIRRAAAQCELELRVVSGS